MRVLVVEDHPRLAETVATVLRREGMAVDVAFDGARGARHGSRSPTTTWSCSIATCPASTATRSAGRWSPTAARAAVLMLTAAGTLEDRVEGLGIGADDYLPKPFHLAELVARIRALSRRSRPALPPTLVHGDLELDSARRRVTRAGRPVALSPKEFAVLELLLGADGAVVSTEQILERAWDDAVDPFTNTVRMTVSRLRAKLGDPPVIETVDPGRLPDRRHRDDAATPAGRLVVRLRHPRTTVRWRLTLLYGGLFLVCGAALLAITYTLVEHAHRHQHAVPRRHRASSGGARSAVVPAAANASATRFTGRQPRAPAIVARHVPPPAPETAASRASGRRVILSVGSEQRISDLHQLVIESSIALAIMALISAALGWVVAGRVLAPLRTMTTATQQISEANLHERLAMQGPPRRAQAARGHDRRPARATRGGVRRPAAVRRQRLARAAHAADRGPGAARDGPERPEGDGRARSGRRASRCSRESSSRSS